MFLTVVTENLNWEILTKNLVTFKRWDEAIDEKLFGFTKNPILGGGGRGVTKN